ncbi:unnamed protein product [Pleuronectes platessa]|uniref:Uncharacterized protein n=1 Tax=Pleuronectes platessa TaxID=8262 RepID=A0A9N7VKJ5_PLEPL|nr:unnamed protein product [Pleuronectes platessa]
MGGKREGDRKCNKRRDGEEERGERQSDGERLLLSILTSALTPVLPSSLLRETDASTEPGLPPTPPPSAAQLHVRHSKKSPESSGGPAADCRVCPANISSGGFSLKKKRRGARNARRVMTLTPLPCTPSPPPLGLNVHRRTHSTDPTAAASPRETAQTVIAT